MDEFQRAARQFLAERSELPPIPPLIALTAAAQLQAARPKAAMPMPTVATPAAWQQQATGSEVWAAAAYAAWEADQDWAESRAEAFEAARGPVGAPAEAARGPVGAPAAKAVAEPPWRQRPNDDLWDADDDLLQPWLAEGDEAEQAAEHGIPWADRGPPAPASPTEYWRGQRWRPNTERWSRRGGRNRLFWECYYSAMRQGAPRIEAWDLATRLHGPADAE